MDELVADPNYREDSAFEEVNTDAKDHIYATPKCLNNKDTSKFQCSYDDCGAVFRSKLGKRKHEMKHSGDYPFNCKICDKKFALRSQYEFHVKSHSGKQGKCKVCGAIPKSESGQRIHQSLHSDKVFECPICDKSFKCEFYMKRHIKTHTSSFVCVNCGKGFTSLEYLKVHEKIHDSSYHLKCTVEACDFSTKHKSSLRRHLKSHDKLEQQLCSTCGKSYRRKDALKKHEATCTTDNIWTFNY